MSRLLIITAWYHPFIHPRAHRWTALAEYWAAQGAEVHVVCARRRDCPGESVVNGVQVHRVGFDSLKEVFYYWFGSVQARGRVGGGVQRPSRRLRLLNWVYNTFWKKIYFPDDAGLWYFPARKKVLRLLEQQAFDGVISVSLPFTGHLIGLAAKRRFPGLQWLADIGDPFTIQAQPLHNTLLYGRLGRRLEKTVLETADVVVVTNAAAIRAYQENFGVIAGKLAVIPPLLHPPPEALRVGPFFRQTDAPAAGMDEPPTLGTSGLPILHIGYFGAFYAPVRVPDAFLNLLEQTFALRPDWRGRLQVHFFGDIFPEFLERLSRQPAIQLYGLRSREDVRAAMQLMDILLNIGNSTDYQLPSKAVEYFASCKPVVHLSCVEHDPFTAFWGDNPGLLNLKVEHGAVSEPEVLRWIAFLEGDRPVIPEVSREAQLRPFMIGAVAVAYVRLLGLGQWLSAEPDTVATPGRR